MHPKLKLIVVGDDLYSKQPFIEEVKSQKMSYILVAKESDHQTLYENIDLLNQIGEVHEKEIIDENNNVHSYRWVNGVKLNKTKNPIKVNYFEYQEFDSEKDKITFSCSWVTDIVIDPDNIIKLVKGGRSRWKIENETFNILKNNGYHIEHNYGHGKENLSMNFFILNLIAFYIHQILRLTNKLYNEVRAQFSSWLEFWSRLRSLINTFVFESWDILLDLIRAPENYKLIPTNK